MNKFLTTAAVLVALATPAAAANFTCFPPVSTREANPVTSIEFTIEKDGGLTVVHALADGSTRNRADQYFETKVSRRGTSIVWTGRLLSNPRMTAMGVFETRGKPTYTENRFRDGQFVERSGPYRCVNNGEGEE